jgi:hypothetical protein
MSKRHEIMTRKRVSDVELAAWFHYDPVSKPAPRAGTRPTSPKSPVRQKAVRGR